MEQLTMITLDTLSPNFHRLNGAYGAKSWFSYGTLIATKISEDTETVHVTGTKYSATTSKHLNVVKQWASSNGYDVQVAEDDDLQGWAA